METNTFGTVISLVAGIITVMGAIAVVVSTTNITIPKWSKNKEKVPAADDKKTTYSAHELPVDNDALRWSVWWGHRGMVLFYVIIGLILTFGPNYLFGPTWFYFSSIPHGGSGMGIACLALALALIIGIHRRSKLIVSTTLFAGGITFWIAAFMIGAQGIAAHTGAMEAPFMMYAAVDMLIRAAVIRR